VLNSLKLIKGSIVNKFILLALIFVSGCSTMVDQNFKHEFTYDYNVPGKTKNELWKSARNFIATTYVDSTKVIRVADEETGTLIGMGVVGWLITPISDHACNYNYSIKFAAKDSKARLQFDLQNVIGGCGWDRPSADGYQQIENQFNAIGAKLGENLAGKTDKIFKDF
jgi:hypothetical protein